LWHRQTTLTNSALMLSQNEQKDENIILGSGKLNLSHSNYKRQNLRYIYKYFLQDSQNLKTRYEHQRYLTSAS